MKNIATKSVLKKKTAKDGLRICVMRRIRPEYDFDVWIPVLAPTEKLLKGYVIDKKMKWGEFSKKYKTYVIERNMKLINTLYHLSQRGKITLLCYENSIKHCHRYWIVKKLKEISRLKSQILK